MPAPAKWYVCRNCSHPFTAYAYRSHCFVCGGDDVIHWGKVLLVGLAFNVLLALPLIWRLWRG